MTSLLAAATLDGLAARWLPMMLDATIKGMAVLAVAGVVLLAMRRTSAAARQLVLLIALVGLLIVPIVSVALPGWRVLPAWAKFEAPPVEPAAPAPTIAQVVPVSPTPRPTDRTPIEPSTPPVAPLVTPSPKPVELPAAPVEVAAADPVPSPVQKWIGWGMVTWLAGLAVFLLPLVLGRISIRRLRRGAVPLTDGPLWDMAAAAQAQLRLKGRVTLLVSHRRPMPMMWGIVRPVLLLPAEAIDWSADRLWVVMLHELGHVKRRDMLTKVLAHLAAAFYWFNPLVWLAYRRFQTEAERACDDLVLAAGSNPGDYAEHILAIASGLQTQMFAAHGSIAMARPNKLEGRLLAILDPRRSRRRLTLLLTLLAIVIGLSVLIPLSILRPRDAAVKKPTEPSQTGAKDAAAPPATQPDAGWGPAVGSVRMRLVTDSGRILDGELPKLVVVIENTSDRPIFFEKGGGKLPMFRHATLWNWNMAGREEQIANLRKDPGPHAPSPFGPSTEGVPPGGRVQLEIIDVASLRATLTKTYPQRLVSVADFYTSGKELWHVTSNVLEIDLVPPPATQGEAIRPDYEMGKTIARSLAESGNPWAALKLAQRGKAILPGLIAVIERGDAPVAGGRVREWEYAAFLAGRIGDTRAAPFLARRVGTKDTQRPDIFFVQPMGELGVKEIIPYLVNWLGEEKLWVLYSQAYGSDANYILKALQQLTGKDFGASNDRVDANAKKRKQIMEAVQAWWAAEGKTQYAPPAPPANDAHASVDLDALYRQIADGDWYVQQQAAEKLGRTPPADEADRARREAVLLGLVGTPADEYSLRVLAGCGGPKAVERLTRLLDDPDIHRAVQTAWVLAQLRDRPAAQKAIRRLAIVGLFHHWESAIGADNIQFQVAPNLTLAQTVHTAQGYPPWVTGPVVIPDELLTVFPLDKAEQAFACLLVTTLHGTDLDREAKTPLSQLRKKDATWLPVLEKLAAEEPSVWPLTVGGKTVADFPLRRQAAKIVASIIGKNADYIGLGGEKIDSASQPQRPYDNQNQMVAAFAVTRLARLARLDPPWLGCDPRRFSPIRQFYDFAMPQLIQSFGPDMPDLIQAELKRSGVDKELHVLPGGDQPVCSVMRANPTAWVAVCKAEEIPAKVEDRGNYRGFKSEQKFKVIQVLSGKSPIESAVTLQYTWQDVLGGSRPVDKGETVIWIIRSFEYLPGWWGMQCLPDTPENRKAAADAATADPQPANPATPAAQGEIDSPSLRIYRAAEVHYVPWLPRGVPDDADFMPLSSAQLLDYILAWQGATGEGCRAVTCFLHKTVDRPELRRKIVAELGPRLKQAQAKNGSLHNSKDDKWCWVICLAALGAHDELVAAMEREPSCQTCCGWDVFVPIIVSFGKIEDAWTLVRKVEQGGGDGNPELLNGALEKLTGHIMPLPVPARNDDEGRIWQIRELAGQWTKYLTEQKIPDRRVRVSQSAAPATRAEDMLKTFSPLAQKIVAGMPAGWRLVGCGTGNAPNRWSGVVRSEYLTFTHDTFQAIFPPGPAAFSLWLTPADYAGRLYDSPLAQAGGASLDFAGPDRLLFMEGGVPKEWKDWSPVVTLFESLGFKKHTGEPITPAAVASAKRWAASQPDKDQPLPGSTRTIEQALEGGRFDYAAVSTATTAPVVFSDKSGTAYASQLFKAETALAGHPDTRSALPLAYTFQTSVGKAAERPILKDERVIWIVLHDERGGMDRHGVKALADTPTNREAVKRAAAIVREEKAAFEALSRPMWSPAPANSNWWVSSSVPSAGLLITPKGYESANHSMEFRFVPGHAKNDADAAVIVCLMNDGYKAVPAKGATERAEEIAVWRGRRVFFWSNGQGWPTARAEVLTVLEATAKPAAPATQPGAGRAGAGYALTITFPAYMGLPPLVTQQAPAAVPAGSRLDWRFTYDKPVTAAHLELTVEGEKPLIIAAQLAADGMSAQAQTALDKSAAWREVHTVDGISSATESLRIEAQPDNPPVAELAVVERLDDSISVRYRATDDYGLVSLRLLAVSAGENLANLPLPAPKGVAVVGQYKFEFAKLANPSVALSGVGLVLEATDNRPGEPQTAKSQPVPLRFRPPRRPPRNRRTHPRRGARSSSDWPA